MEEILGFLEGVASPPVGTPPNKNINCPLLQQSVNGILSGLAINQIFSISLMASHMF